jgi:hypothetical protein
MSAAAASLRSGQRSPYAEPEPLLGCYLRLVSFFRYPALFASIAFATAASPSRPRSGAAPRFRLFRVFLQALLLFSLEPTLPAASASMRRRSSASASITLLRRPASRDAAPRPRPDPSLLLRLGLDATLLFGLSLIRRSSASASIRRCLRPQPDPSLLFGLSLIALRLSLDPSLSSTSARFDAAPRPQP